MTASKPAPSSAGLAAPLAADLERLRPGLRMIALRALGDGDLADEAVQETLARAVAALAEGRLGDAAKLPAYVAGIARHVCAHLVRDRKPTVALEDDAGNPTIHPQLQTRFDPLETLISAADTQRLRVAFHALPSDDQQLLRLCFHEERTPAEVAAALGEPAERIRKRKSRALERLRRAFLGDADSHDEPPSGTEKMAPPPPNDIRNKTGHD